MLAQLAGIACSSCPFQKDCDGSKGWAKFKIDDVIMHKCPLPLITNMSARLIAQWPHYNQGYLPVTGGILEQTAVYVQAMALIGSEVNKHQQEQAEKQRRKRA